MMEQPQVQHDPAQEGQEWQRLEGNMWRGADNVWYRVENDHIMRSEDGTTWERAEDNRFQTADGMWYRYQDGELQRSPDGETWGEAEDWSDQDGRSFRFDDEGNVMTREGAPDRH